MVDCNHLVRPSAKLGRKNSIVFRLVRNFFLLGNNGREKFCSEDVRRIFKKLFVQLCVKVIKIECLK